MDASCIPACVPADGPTVAGDATVDDELEDGLPADDVTVDDLQEDVGLGLACLDSACLASVCLDSGATAVAAAAAYPGWAARVVAAGHFLERVSYLASAHAQASAHDFPAPGVLAAGYPAQRLTM